jgi:Arc/MetJ-type ribon-helix-helix transcriptional regulator
MSNFYIKTAQGARKLSKRNKTNWNIPVSKTLDEAVEEAVRRDSHSTKSDFVRDATRRLLEKMNIPLDLQKEDDFEPCETKDGDCNAKEKA